MRAKYIAADTQIKDDKVAIAGYTLYPDGSNAATLVLYNEADNSATAAKMIAAARTAATASLTELFDDPIYCDAGCYADISGTGAVAVIYIK